MIPGSDSFFKVRRLFILCNHNTYSLKGLFHVKVILVSNGTKLEPTVYCPTLNIGIMKHNHVN